MGLFSKDCVICGGSGGALSSRKLADGHICGDCAKRLSPWFDDFKSSTAEDIKTQLNYRDENRRALDDFEVTKSRGIKKYAEDMQYAYDAGRRAFVIVEGPAETAEDFADRNPDIIQFDQVNDVWLEVDEYWTEGAGEFELKPFNQTITQEKYKEVYWRYDFYLNIETDHPYAERIRYKMNYKPTIMKVPQRGIFFRRGIGIGGTYRGEELAELAEYLEAFADSEADAIELRNKLDVLLLKHKDRNAIDSVRAGIKAAVTEEIYFKKIGNMGAHAARAARISRLLLGK